MYKQKGENEITHYTYLPNVGKSPIKTQRNNTSHLFAVALGSVGVDGVKRLHAVFRSWQML